MIRVMFVLLGLALALVAGYCGYRMLASDETRIRWLLQDAAVSFNNMNLRGCVGAFDQDYREKTTGLGLLELKNALRVSFLQRVDPKTKAFLYRIRVPEQGISVKVGDNGEQAEAQFTLYLEGRQHGAFETQWQIAVTAELHKADNGDWRIHSSSHETLDGQRPR
ncbi:MAG: hypothetical protein V3U11_11850 [Planctomycetota bacterium]